MKNLLLKNATIVNEGETFKGSIVVSGEYIDQIIRQSDYKTGELYECFIQQIATQMEVLDVSGKYILPGVIDTHVHFREPGDGWKGNIESESRAAVLGGVTSFMDMPNNTPPALTLSLLEDKFASAEISSYANYSFYLGASNSNIQEIKSMRCKDICGVKLFMGASTGNLMVDDDRAVEDVFKSSPTLIAVHCEDNQEILSNLKKAEARYGADIPPQMHSMIRSRAACLKSSQKAVLLAQKYKARLHILHVSTKEEVLLLAGLKNPAIWKRRDKDRKAMITGEACASYLWFCSEDYVKYGNLIKCNPSIKSAEDMMCLRKALKNGVLQTIGSDHAPHLVSEKLRPYLESPSGIPLVQYSLQMMLTMARYGEFTLADVADKMSHSPASCYALEKRGFIRSGYFADIVVVDIENQVNNSLPRSMCRWSPFSERNIIYHRNDNKDEQLSSFPVSVVHTIVNGCLVVKDGMITGNRRSRRLKFDR